MSPQIDVLIDGISQKNRKVQEHDNSETESDASDVEPRSATPSKEEPQYREWDEDSSSDGESSYLKRGSALTARQRSKSVGVDSELVSLPLGKHSKSKTVAKDEEDLDDEASLRKSEQARKRKLMLMKQEEEEKVCLFNSPPEN